jgi:hypothetical protein
MKLLQSVMSIISVLWGILDSIEDMVPEAMKKELIDFAMDQIEKKAVEEKKPEMLAACKIIRKVINVPDDDINDATPI